jgi:uncharacterized repeat protein (TIGR03943 family)
VRREAQNVLLILVGGALLKIAVNGDYLRYVKPSQQPWMLGGGAVIVLLGVVAIVRDVRAARSTAVQRPGHEHHHPARASWLLLLPVLAVFLVAPPALGADSVERTPARTAQAAPADSGFPQLPAGDVVSMPVSEFVTRAGWDRGGSLDGRTVQLTGFVLHDDGDTMLGRWVIGCCAADAFPVTVRLLGGDVEQLPGNSWIEVTGEVVPGTAVSANGYTPDLTVGGVRRVGQPADPYEH